MKRTVPADTGPLYAAADPDDFTPRAHLEQLQRPVADVADCRHKGKMRVTTASLRLTGPVPKVKDEGSVRTWLWSAAACCRFLPLQRCDKRREQSGSKLPHSKTKNALTSASPPGMLKLSEVQNGHGNPRDDLGQRRC